MAQRSGLTRGDRRRDAKICECRCGAPGWRTTGLDRGQQRPDRASPAQPRRRPRPQPGHLHHRRYPDALLLLHPAGLVTRTPGWDRDLHREVASMTLSATGLVVTGHPP